LAELVADATMFDAALKVLAERGYAVATTRRIADAAGVNE
jgi:AcrR family transcriptional regulator